MKIVKRGMKTTHQLISEKKNSLQAKFAMAEVEEVLKRGAEEIDGRTGVRTGRRTGGGTRGRAGLTLALGRQVDMAFGAPFFCTQSEVFLPAKLTERPAPGCSSLHLSHTLRA